MHGGMMNMMNMGSDCDGSGAMMNYGGPGTMMGRGGMMGYGGMMGHGRMMMGAPGAPGGPRAALGDVAFPLDQESALKVAERHLAIIGNDNLTVGDIRDRGQDFEVAIVTRNGSLVDKLLINKQTGWLRSAYLWGEGLQTEDQVRRTIERTLTFSGNPNLKVGDIRKTDSGFEVEIATRDGDTVGTIVVNPNAGWSCYPGQTY